jgi:hypothetical protein
VGLEELVLVEAVALDRVGVLDRHVLVVVLVLVGVLVVVVLVVVVLVLGHGDSGGDLEVEVSVDRRVVRGLVDLRRHRRIVREQRALRAAPDAEPEDHPADDRGVEVGDSRM